MENLRFEFNDTTWVLLAPTFNDTIWALLATVSLAWVVDQNKSNFYKEREKRKLQNTYFVPLTAVLLVPITKGYIR